MTATLRFGAGLLGHYSRAYSVSRVAELGALCERLGFDSYWIADQRWMRDVWVSLAATALRTSRIQLGTRVTDPYVRHPALTAVAIASLDELSGGAPSSGSGPAAPDSGRWRSSGRSPWWRSARRSS